MKKVYVLTNETNENCLLGVYSTMALAINSMLAYATDCMIGRIDIEEIGTWYHFNWGDESPEMVCYIEECDLDDPVYMQMNKMRGWN